MTQVMTVVLSYDRELAQIVSYEMARAMVMMAVLHKKLSTDNGAGELDRLKD